MTALETIPKITELLGLLIKRIKDRETFALVQQIQEHQLVIQTALLDAERKMTQMERDHLEAVSALTKTHRQAIAERDAKIAELQKPGSNQVSWGSRPRIKGRMEM